MNNSKDALTETFERAIRENHEVVGVRIEMDGFPEDEIIINPIVNAEDKLKYYQDTYDGSLHHKYADAIRIVGWASGDVKEAIESLGL